MAFPSTPTSWMYVYNDGSFVSNSGAAGIDGANWSTPRAAAGEPQSVNDRANQPQESVLIPLQRSVLLVLRF